jgi:hypothetical protein
MVMFNAAMKKRLKTQGRLFGLHICIEVCLSICFIELPADTSAASACGCFLGINIALQLLSVSVFINAKVSLENDTFYDRVRNGMESVWSDPRITVIFCSYFESLSLILWY